MSKTVTIRLSDDLEEDFKQFIKEENISQSEAIREALQQYMSVRNFRRLRQKTLPFAENRGILTDADVFQLMS